MSSVPNTRDAGRLIERRRQDREHRDAEQRADRVADQPRHQPGAGGIVDEENAGGDQEPAQAADQAQPERDEERRHRTGSYQDAMSPLRARTSAAGRGR